MKKSSMYGKHHYLTAMEKTRDACGSKENSPWLKGVADNGASFLQEIP
jgi:hypothetical protein